MGCRWQPNMYSSSDPPEDDSESGLGLMDAGWRTRSSHGFGSGAGIRTLNLAVNRSAPSDHELRFVFVWCRQVPPCSTVFHRGLLYDTVSGPHMTADQRQHVGAVWVRRLFRPEGLERSAGRPPPLATAAAMLSADWVVRRVGVAVGRAARVMRRVRVVGAVERQLVWA